MQILPQLQAHFWDQYMDFRLNSMAIGEDTYVSVDYKVKFHVLSLSRKAQHNLTVLHLAGHLQDAER